MISGPATSWRSSAPVGPPLMLPFTRKAVPEIDFVGGRLVIDPPVETEAKPEDDPERGTEGGKT